MVDWLSCSIEIEKMEWIADFEVRPISHWKSQPGRKIPSSIAITAGKYSTHEICCNNQAVLIFNYTAIIIHSYGFDGLAIFNVAARFGHSASTSRARALKQNLFRPVRERFAGQSGHRWTPRSSKRSHLWMFHPRSIKTHLVSSFNLGAEGISHLEKKM